MLCFDILSVQLVVFDFMLVVANGRTIVLRLFLDGGFFGIFVLETTTRLYEVARKGRKARIDKILQLF